MIRRVVVTGLGIISPVGNSTGEVWQSLQNGKDGTGPISSFAYPSFPAKTAGEVKNFNPRDYKIKPKSLKLMNKTIQYAIASAYLAMEDAGIEGEAYPSENSGLALGVDGLQYSAEEFFLACYESTGKDLRINVSPGNKYADIPIHTNDPDLAVHPLWPLSVLANMSLCHISIQQQFQGPNLAFSSIDASGAQSIGEAFKSIRHGESDLYLAGGSYALNTMSFMSLSAMGLLSKENTACPAFDSSENGFTLGEGSVVMILEEKEMAERRGARIYAEITGYSSYYDNSSFSSASSKDHDPSGMSECIKQALSYASLSPADIDYINADGRASIKNSNFEIAALKDVFGEITENIPISTSKPLTGHMLPASGAFEAASTVLSVCNDMIPPVKNCSKQKALKGLNIITENPLEKQVMNAISNTFGFSGEHTSLVFSKYKQ